MLSDPTFIGIAVAALGVIIPAAAGFVVWALQTVRRRVDIQTDLLEAQQKAVLADRATSFGLKLNGKGLGDQVSASELPSVIADAKGYADRESTPDRAASVSGDRIVARLPDLAPTDRATLQAKVKEGELAAALQKSVKLA